MFNVENLLINRPLRGTLFDKSTNDILFCADQLSDASLECSGEQVFINDAMGIKVAGFDRSKDATFTGTSAFINFGLMAAQLGSDKRNADAENQIIVPAFELIEVKNAQTVTLQYEPAEDIKYIYSTHPDKTKNETFKLAASASATEFAISGKNITLPTGKFKIGDLVAVWYSRKTSEAVAIKNTAKEFSKSGRFVLEVLCTDFCDTNKVYYTYIIFNNAKLDNALSINFNNEATHQFTINAMQDYCSANNELFTIIVAP